MTTRLPYLTKLRNSIGNDSSDNFFARFDQRLSGSEVTFEFYRCMDEWLSFIPADEWETFEKKASPVVGKRDLRTYRHWEAFHNVLFEAFGFRILLENLKCRDAKYVPEGRTKKPDFEAFKDGSRFLLEVKKVNPSQDETEMWYGPEDVAPTQKSFAKLQDKIGAVYKNAINQLREHGNVALDSLLVLLIVDPDIKLGASPEDRQRKIGEIIATMEDPFFPIHYVVLPH